VRRLVSASRPVRATEVPRASEKRISTGIGALDEALGGGVVVPSVWLVSGHPGAGKTTRMLALASVVADAVGRDALAVSCEMTAAKTRDTAERAGAKLDRLVIWEGPELSAVEAYARKMRPAAIVLDSLHRIEVKGERRASDAALEAAMAACVAMAKACEAAVFAIAHATKEGHAAGPRGVEHDGDVVVWVERSALVVGKCRFGPGGRVEL
jgi:DNA repair protein RadA/Sms